MYWLTTSPQYLQENRETPEEPIRCSKTIELCTINSSTEASKLKKLKTFKSPGPDGLHPRVLHELANSISTPLSIIFNTSLTTSVLPTDWKTANVSAIHKKGKKNQAQNYRPISLTSIAGKILEQIIRDTVTEHMKDNDLLSDKQFGFIKGRSTVLQLLKDSWTETLENGGCIDVVYCDFMKVFDKVPPWTYIYWTASFARAMRCASGGVCVSCLGSTVCIVYFRSHFATWSLTSMRFLR